MGGGVLEQGDQHAALVHQLDGTVAVVAPLAWQGEGRGLQNRVRRLALARRPPVDGAFPSHREVDLQSVSRQRGHRTATAARAVIVMAASDRRRTGAAELCRRRCNRRRSSAPRTPAPRRSGMARPRPKAAPTAAPPATVPDSPAINKYAYKLKVVTMVTTPRPSWNPNPAP